MCFRFRTLLHGDFKAANILHSADGTQCAAYDFQYVGEGYGVQDVVMLLHSSLQVMVGKISYGGPVIGWVV
jgi:Ser/Thr protein kinase RdoA (MazF antagonist)